MWKIQEDEEEHKVLSWHRKQVLCWHRYPIKGTWKKDWLFVWPEHRVCRWKVCVTRDCSLLRNGTEGFSEHKQKAPKDLWTSTLPAQLPPAYSVGIFKYRNLFWSRVKALWRLSYHTRNQLGVGNWCKETREQLCHWELIGKRKGNDHFNKFTLFSEPHKALENSRSLRL